MDAKTAAETAATVRYLAAVFSASFVGFLASRLTGLDLDTAARVAAVSY